MQKACESFIELIKAQKYYEAHEALEELWYPRRFEKSDEILLVKGFINASVAFELVKRGRMEAARRTWKVYLKYRPLLQSVSSPALSDFRRVDEAIGATYEQVFRA